MLSKVNKKKYQPKSLVGAPLRLMKHCRLERIKCLGARIGSHSTDAASLDDGRITNTPDAFHELLKQTLSRRVRSDARHLSALLVKRQTTTQLMRERDIALPHRSKLRADRVTQPDISFITWLVTPKLLWTL
jgi:hypothetical protein